MKLFGMFFCTIFCISVYLCKTLALLYKMLFRYTHPDTWVNFWMRDGSCQRSLKQAEKAPVLQELKLKTFIPCATVFQPKYLNSELQDACMEEDSPGE